VSARSSPGLRPRVIARMNSASSRPWSELVPSSPSCVRHERHVASARSVPVCVMVASRRGLVPHASSPVSVAAWVAAWLLLPNVTTAGGRPDQDADRQLRRDRAVGGQGGERVGQPGVEHRRVDAPGQAPELTERVLGAPQGGVDQLADGGRIRYVAAVAEFLLGHAEVMARVASRICAPSCRLRYR